MGRIAPGMIPEPGSTTPRFVTTTVTTPAMEAAAAPVALPRFQSTPPTKGTKQEAARNAYTEFSSPRILLEARARAVEVNIKPTFTIKVMVFS